MFSYEPPHMAEQKQGDQLEPTYRSSVRIRDVALRTCQKRWTIRRSGERGSGISVLEARQDDEWWFAFLDRTLAGTTPPGQGGPNEKEKWIVNHLTGFSLSRTNSSSLVSNKPVNDISSLEGIENHVFFILFNKLNLVWHKVTV